MSKKTLAKQLIEIYQTKDGASLPGAYRDAITDILHIAYEDMSYWPSLPKGPERINNLAESLLKNALDVFIQEIT